MYCHPNCKYYASSQVENRADNLSSATVNGLEFRLTCQIYFSLAILNDLGYRSILTGQRNCIITNIKNVYTLLFCQQ